MVDSVASTTEVYYSPSWKSKMKVPECCFLRKSVNRKLLSCVWHWGFWEEGTAQAEPQKSLSWQTHTLCSVQHWSFNLCPAAPWLITYQYPHVSQNNNCYIIITSPGGHCQGGTLGHLLPRDLSRTVLPLWALSVTSPFSVLCKAIFLIQMPLGAAIMTCPESPWNLIGGRTDMQFVWALDPKSAPSKSVTRWIWVPDRSRSGLVVSDADLQQAQLIIHSKSGIRFSIFLIIWWVV